MLTVRHINCTFVEQSFSRCIHCRQYRKTLLALKQKKKMTDQQSTSKFANVRFLENDELQSKIKHLRHELKLANSKIEELELKITSDSQKEGMILDGKTSSDFITIMKYYNEHVISAYPKDSFQHIFWRNQLEVANKSPNAIRWHPMMLKWCIFLKHKSPSAYELLRKSKCIVLPSQRTLRSYIHYYDSKSGFSKELDKQLLDASQLIHDEDQSFKKCVILLGDEMHIREGLVFKKGSGDLVGYTELGDINDHLLKLEEKFLNDSLTTKKKLATTVLVLMVRGLFSQFNFVYASFPSRNLTGDQLVPIMYEGIFRIERCGLHVMGLTLDGNSVNRKFFKLIGLPTTTTTSNTNIKYHTNNPMSMNKRKLLFFSDPPHLIKTSRNCLATRNMEVSTIIIVYLYLHMYI